MNKLSYDNLTQVNGGAGSGSKYQFYWGHKALDMSKTAQQVDDEETVDFAGLVNAIIPGGWDKVKDKTLANIATQFSFFVATIQGKLDSAWNTLNPDDPVSNDIY